MLHGLMVVNAFLRTAKFDEIYHTLLDAATDLSMALDMRTNAELMTLADTLDPAQTDFILFWDKDVQLAMRLEQRGFRVFNSAEGILRCDDKALTWLTLYPSGIPMPRTLIAPKTFANIGYTDMDFAAQAGRALGYPLVLKECFGSFGQQVYLMHTEDELKQKVSALAGTPMLFQQLISESYGRDARLNVVGGRVVASMLRKSTDGDFRSNLSRGGCMERYQPTDEEKKLAIAATELLGLDFAGVDVLFGKDGPMLCEVNSNAHFKTTLKCTGVNMAQEIMRHIARKLEERA